MTTSGDAGPLTPALGTTGLDEFELDDTLLAPPPRRKRLPFATAALGTCVAVGVGVVGGIGIQKHWGGSSSAGSGRAAALAALGRGSSGTGSASGRGGGASQFARSGTVGTVKAIDGKNFYVTDAQGNVVKVTTSAATTVRVTETASLKKIKPGDNVVVQGTQTKTGYSATSVTDSGSQSAFAGGAGGFGGGSSSGAGTGFGGSNP